MRIPNRSATSGTVSHSVDEIVNSSVTDRNRTLTAVDVAVTDPMVGLLLEQRYRIKSKIAQGGMAVVYEAFDERLERIVAVKLMHPSYASDPVFLSRFMREAKSAAALNHPHIVAVFDQGQHDNMAYLVMEKVDGTTLRGILQERGALTPAEAIGVMEPILSALAQAHQRGIAHRDVKPENVLVSTTGVVKVADFGLARAVESAQQQLTAKSQVLGSVSYLAPEQIMRSESDARTDVYAAGILLYELLTGAKPYRGESPMNIAYQHVSSEVPPPSTIVSGVPSGLDDLVMWATRKEPDERPATAGEFLTALEAVRRRFGIVPAIVAAPGPAAATQVLPDRGRPATAVMPTVGSGGGHIVGSVTPPTVGIADPDRMPRHDGPTQVIPPPYRAPSADEQRRKRLLIGGIAAGVALVLILALGWWFTSLNNVEVPKFAGLTKAQAERVAKDKGLKISYDEPEFSDDIPQDVVLRQRPPEGKTIDSGSTVTLVLSGGKQVRKVPQVSGKSEEEATSLLKAERLKPTVTTEESTTIPSGQAIRTDPRAGTSLRVGSDITLVMSKGPGSTTVPDVAGLNQADAEALLDEKGLKATTTTEASDDVPVGNVIRQNPPPNSSVDKGSSVELVVSKGPDMVTVPNVGGMTFAQAKKALEAVGLKAKKTGSDNGRVFIQNPSSGGQVPSGTTVTLVMF